MNDYQMYLIYLTIKLIDPIGIIAVFLIFYLLSKIMTFDWLLVFIVSLIAIPISPTILMYSGFTAFHPMDILLFSVPATFIQSSLLYLYKNKDIKNKSIEKSNETVDLKKERVQENLNILEKESIEQSVKNDVTNEEENLQNIINKAISNGEVETAQALLKILNTEKASI